MKLSDFTKANACANKSAEVVVTKTASNRHLDEAIIVKDFFKDILIGDFQWSSYDDLKEEVAASYTDANIDEVEETQEGYVRALTGQIRRFYRSEKRFADKAVEQGLRKIFLPEEPIVLDLTKMLPLEVDFEGADEVECRIDCIDDNKNTKIVEGIIVKKGAPKLGKTTSAYHNVFNESPLQMARLALRKYCDTFLQVGESVTIVASYYYAKKSSDKGDSLYADDYYATDCPTRSINEKYTRLPDDAVYGSDQYPLSDADKELIELLDKWATGYEACDMKEDKDCVGCKDYYICKYKQAPKALEEEKAIKQRKKCVLSDEQEAIVNATEGIFICNAVPGAGKTETAIKQRTVNIILGEVNELVEKYESGEDVVCEYEEKFISKDDGGYQVARKERGTTRDGKLPTDWLD